MSLSKNNHTSAEFHHQLLLQKPDCSVRHQSVEMLTETVTSWISTDTDALYSAQETETFSKERLLRDLIIERSLALNIQKKKNATYPPFSVVVSEASDANKISCWSFILERFSYQVHHDHILPLCFFQFRLFLWNKNYFKFQNIGI